MAKYSVFSMADVILNLTKRLILGFSFSWQLSWLANMNNQTRLDYGQY